VSHVIRLPIRRYFAAQTLQQQSPERDEDAVDHRDNSYRSIGARTGLLLHLGGFIHLLLLTATMIIIIDLIPGRKVLWRAKQTVSKSRFRVPTPELRPRFDVGTGAMIAIGHM
jgi:hypothetical protein